MGILQLLFIVIGGLLAVPSLLAKSPKAEEMIEKIKPSQGYIGIALLIWGIVDLILMFVFITGYFSNVVYGLIQLLAVAVEIALGFLLSANLLKSFKKVPKRDVKNVKNKLQPFQGWVGVIAIFIGILRFVFYVVMGLSGVVS